jgi:hypothetical protein
VTDHVLTVTFRTDTDKAGVLETEQGESLGDWRAFCEALRGECLCAEIDPSDRPCLSCEAIAALGEEE